MSKPVLAAVVLTASVEATVATALAASVTVINASAPGTPFTAWRSTDERAQHHLVGRWRARARRQRDTRRRRHRDETPFDRGKLLGDYMGMTKSGTTFRPFLIQGVSAVTNPTDAYLATVSP